MSATKPDLDSAERIRFFVEAFYAGLLSDTELAPIFLDVARIELDKHLPLIGNYWEKLLLGSGDYRRHTMNIHRAIHARRELTAADFARWLAHFDAVIDASFTGPHAEKAKHIARNIAANMNKALNKSDVV